MGAGFNKIEYENSSELPEGSEETFQMEILPIQPLGVTEEATPPTLGYSSYSEFRNAGFGDIGATVTIKIPQTEKMQLLWVIMGAVGGGLLIGNGLWALGKWIGNRKKASS